MLGGLGGPELLVIFAIILLLFGGNKLPEVARSMGEAMRSFKSEANKMQQEVEAESESPEESESSESQQTQRQSSASQQASSQSSS